MEKSIHSDRQKALQQALRQARLDAGLTQKQLADKLGKPQSFVAKYELGERRLDVIEFLIVCDEVEIDTASIIQALQLCKL